MIGKEFIGRESESVVLKIKLEEVRRLAEAIGIPFNGEVPLTYVGTLLQANISGFELTKFWGDSRRTENNLPTSPLGGG